MASGRNHDRATSLICLPFGLLLGLLMGHWCGLIGGFAFLVGGLWLSPDLERAPMPCAAGGPWPSCGGRTDECCVIAPSGPMAH